MDVNTCKGKSRLLYTFACRGVPVRDKTCLVSSVCEVGQPVTFFPTFPFHSCTKLPPLTYIVLIYYNLIPHLLAYVLPKMEEIRRLNANVINTNKVKGMWNESIDNASNLYDLKKGLQL